MAQNWHDLLFAHWPIKPEVLRAFVPSELTLEEFDGQSWIGIVPFHMSGIRLHGTPAIPALSAFPELNVRTYVTVGTRPGVYFFSLDAASLPAVWTARTFYKLPYFHAKMSCGEINGEVVYASQRFGGKAEFCGRYRPATPAQLAEHGTLRHWLMERYCLYAVHDHRVYRAEVHHKPWSLQDAKAEIEINTMAQAAGITLPALDPLLYFAKKLEVIIWPLRLVT